MEGQLRKQKDKDRWGRRDEKGRVQASPDHASKALRRVEIKKSLKPTNEKLPKIENSMGMRKKKKILKTGGQEKCVAARDDHAVRR